jgi:hypothetical protein
LKGGVNIRYLTGTWCHLSEGEVLSRTDDFEPLFSIYSIYYLRTTKLPVCISFPLFIEKKYTPGGSGDTSNLTPVPSPKSREFKHLYWHGTPCPYGQRVHTYTYNNVSPTGLFASLRG